MGFSRPEYWSAQPYPSPGDLPNPGIEARSPTLQGVSLPAEPESECQYRQLGPSTQRSPGLLRREGGGWRAYRAGGSVLFPCTCFYVFKAKFG